MMNSDLIKKYNNFFNSPSLEFNMVFVDFLPSSTISNDNTRFTLMAET